MSSEAELLTSYAEHVCVTALSGNSEPALAPPRRLPIFGERPVDYALRTATDDPGFGRYVFSGRMTAERSDLFWIVDALCDPCCATIHEFDQAIRQLRDEGADDKGSDDDGAWEEDPVSPLYERLRAVWLGSRLRELVGRPVLASELAHVCSGIEPLEPPDSPGVYCIKGAGDFVKIGKATRSIRQRIREIQTSHPVKIELWAILSARPEDEAEFHRKLGAARAHGEWFELTGAVIEEIWRARAGRE